MLSLLTLRLQSSGSAEDRSRDYLDTLQVIKWPILHPQGRAVLAGKDLLPNKGWVDRCEDWDMSTEGCWLGHNTSP